MKKIFLFAMVCVLICGPVFAQDFSDEQEDWEEVSGSYVEEEFSPGSVLDNTDETQEPERQEDMLYPEGEENWSLLREDSSSEEL